MKAGFTTNITLGGLTSKATAQRIGGDFNSFIRLANGKFLAAGNDGFCELGGGKNNLQPITAYFEPASIDLGNPNPKRIRRVFLSCKTSADDELKITYVPDSNYDIAKDVLLSSKHDGSKTIPKATSRSLKGNMWTFRISNVNGCDFTIYNLFVAISTLAMYHE